MERKGPVRGHEIHLAGIREVHQLDFAMITNKPHVSEVYNHKFCLAHRSAACLWLCSVIFQVSLGTRLEDHPLPGMRAETHIYGEVSRGPTG